MRVKKEIVSVSYSKNHSNFDYCCSFYVRKKGVNFLFDAICKCGYIAFENVLIDETDMRLLCDAAEDALEILKKYNPKNKGLTVDDATVTIVEIIFSDKNSMSVSMTEQTLTPIGKIRSVSFPRIRSRLSLMCFLSRIKSKVRAQIKSEQLLSQSRIDNVKNNVMSK